MEKFEELSQEKQRRIIDAGMEVFGSPVSIQEIIAFFE